MSELYFGALKDGWATTRLDRMESRLALAAVVKSDDRLARTCARLRLDCLRAGHPLAAKVHTNDLWIAAAAVRYDVPLVTHDAAFQATPGLQVLTGLQSGS
jgi:tRNA(fMet)-specific endonuclease VapC